MATFNLTKAKEKSPLIHSFTLRLNVPKLLEQTLDLIKQTDAKYIRKRLRVAFKGEEGLDAGGVTKGYYLSSEEVFAPSSMSLIRELPLELSLTLTLLHEWLKE